MLVNSQAIGTVARMFHENPPAEFVDSLVHMLLYSQRFLCEPNQYIHYDKGTMSYHEWGRNQIVAGMRGDWLLMLDTDHVFEPDFLERLLNFSKKYDASVVGSLYLKKSPPHAPVANMWLDDDKMVSILDIPREADYVLAGAVGAGGLLVKREVFDKIEEAFPGVGPFTRYGKFSEDYSFCARCRDVGVPVHLAVQIENPHLIRKPLKFKDYVAPDGADVQISNGQLKNVTKA